MKIARGGGLNFYPKFTFPCLAPFRIPQPLNIPTFCTLDIHDENIYQWVERRNMLCNRTFQSIKRTNDTLSTVACNTAGLHNEVVHDTFICAKAKKLLPRAVFIHLWHITIG